MINEPAVIAYPVDNSPSRRSNSSLMEDNVYSSSIGDSKFADDTIEMSGNFFSQLDSMIAAVKVESSALDSMKEKLKEVENLRNQISNFTKRLLDADQANLNLKANLVKVQEMFAEIKKSKAEVESSIVPLRAELNRTKEQCNKERAGRMAAQQQVAQLKDQVAMLEAANENLDREAKTIPALSESNEILKNDLAQLRRRSRDEKAHMAKHIKGLEAQARDVESIKGAVRDLSMKLLDLASGGASSTTASSSVAGMQQMQMQGMQAAAGLNPNSAAFIAQQQQARIQQQQQQQQQQRYMQQAASASAPSGYYQSPYAAQQPMHQQHLQHLHQPVSDEDNDYGDEEEEESGDYDDGEGAGAVGSGGSAEYDQGGSFAEVNSSIESMGSVALIGKAGAGPSGAGKGSGAGSGGKKKDKDKVVRKVVAGPAGQQGGAGRQMQQQQQQQQPRMMQQLDGGSSGNLHQQQQAHQQMYQQPQQYRGGGSGGGGNPQQQGGFSLPRI